MTNLEKVGIRVAPFSQRVVLARFGKDPNVALDTRDAMNEFLRAIVEYVGVGNEVQFGGGDEQFVVTLKKHAPPATDRCPLTVDMFA
ncbi:hypothetical protein HFN98_24635 [Rhizobium laguerreae]|uniref:hypothetical protein n=1 Tax=Rhizobium laguerreae TaxID=1076926 RepID=UPI001C91EA36|nr:hypothetical protein [Rhizobium laguerreae]MBY3333781.1 hypothetical protein [Rhizobium laguerreae]